jgi:hypothetical protein
MLQSNREAEIARLGGLTQPSRNYFFFSLLNSQLVLTSTALSQLRKYTNHLKKKTLSTTYSIQPKDAKLIKFRTKCGFHAFIKIFVSFTLIKLMYATFIPHFALIMDGNAFIGRVSNYSILSSYALLNRPFAMTPVRVSTSAKG